MFLIIIHNQKCFGAYFIEKISGIIATDIKFHQI